VENYNLFRSGLITQGELDRKSVAADHEKRIYDMFIYNLRKKKVDKLLKQFEKDETIYERYTQLIKQKEKEQYKASLDKINLIYKRDKAMRASYSMALEILHSRLY